jgi:protein TonB
VAQRRRSLWATFYSVHPQPPSHAPRQVVDESAPDVPMNPSGGSGVGMGQGPRGLVIPGSGKDGVGLEPPNEVAVTPPIRQKMSEGVMAGALVHQVDPVYPTIARAMHLSGEVRLRAIISTDGSVQHLEILSGSPILARAAEEAVRQWRYRPTKLSGVPVEVETYITVKFILGQ